MSEEISWFVPGRIEVLGKHTDYAGGRSLLAAVDRGHTVHARPWNGNGLRVTSSIVRETVEIPFADDVPRRGGGHWSGYVATVVERLQQNFPGMLRPAEINIESDLPLAAGMSSSSALVVGLTMALLDHSGISSHSAFTSVVKDRETLSEYLGCVENGQSYGPLAGRRGVGTFGGSEDHTAMLCGKEGTLVQYSFCPVTFEREVPFPSGYALVVAVSGVAAEKTGAAMELYNRASLATREILGRWNRESGRADATLAAAARSAEDAPSRLHALVRSDDYLTRRLRQFLSESDVIIPAASDALSRGDLAAFASLVDESQRLTTEDLGNQVPETVSLQRLARENGAVAASAFGAGFGGSVWALVPENTAHEFAQEWLDAYGRQYPATANASTWLVTRPGPAAHRQ
ncbi:galactokinase [Dermabacteraceae bacterium TAE3-ERU5]|nr:galactokinase [Dermabacteraceae bacterium TAE3-ERU5]